MYFASMTLPELAPILTIFVGMLLGFYGLLKFVLRQQATVQELDRNERIQLTKAFTRVAEATETAAKEAKDRNGHLAEMELQSQQMFQTLADRNYHAITNIKNQKVVNQVVEHEVVQNREEPS